jgi:3-hydroxyisobutyrate dehydrogenase-like beta-hydroxyacid dehydrogenase
MAKVAFLRLGVMGYPMAGHLKTKGGHGSGLQSHHAKAQNGRPVRRPPATTPKQAAEGQIHHGVCRQ